MTKKHDPITIVPETLTAPWIKRFFKEFFDIPVRVKSANSDGYVCVWIPHNSSAYRTKSGCLPIRAITWDHEFPEELGNRCMRIVYYNSKKLSEQNWGGNIRNHAIGMLGPQLRNLLCDLVNERNAVCCD